MSGMIAKKKCAKCGLEKAVDQFFKTSRRPDGLQCSCKECEKGHPVTPRNAWETITHKVCTRCKEDLPIDRFPFTGKDHKRRMPHCKKCNAVKNKLYREAHPIRDRKPGRLKEYGLTPEEYEKLFDQQKGVCAICQKSETRLHQSGTLCALSIDHDHDTDVVRGLLCSPCNLGLGLFQEDPMILMKALQYLGDSYAVV